MDVCYLVGGDGPVDSPSPRLPGDYGGDLIPVLCACLVITVDVVVLRLSLILSYLRCC